LRSAVYCRFSAEMQSPRSIGDQERECRSFAVRQGWEVVLVRADEAVRAGASAGRAGYQALLEAAKRREFEILLVEEVSRFSRDFLGGIAQLAELKALGVRLADTKGGIVDLSSAEGQLKIAFNLVSSQQETQRLGERSKRGLKGKVLDKFSSGGQPAYGYQRVPLYSDTQLDVDGRPKRIGVRLEPHTTEAPIVRRIFTMYSEGVTKHGIARALNTDRIPTRRAGQARSGRSNSGTWTAAAIKRILGNEIYVGERVWNRSSRTGDKLPRSGKKQLRPNRPEEWVHVKGFTSPLIDEQLWAAVQQRLKTDGEKYKHKHVANQDKRYLLSGMLRCASCGANFVIGAHQGRPRAPHYRCSFRASRGSAVCSNKVAVSQPALEARIREMLDVVIKDPARLQELVAEHNKRISTANEAQLVVVRSLETRKKALEEERDRLIQAIALGTGAAKILVAEVDKRVVEIEEISGRITSSEAALQPLLIPRPAALADYLSGNASLFKEDYAQSRQFVERVIDHVLVLADGSIVVQFREASLFEPVRFCRAPAPASTQGPEGSAEPLADARKAHLEEYQRMRQALEQQLTPEQLAGLEVDVLQDPDGNPAFVFATKGAVTRTWGPAGPDGGGPGRGGSASPGRGPGEGGAGRKIALASPAGHCPYCPCRWWPELRAAGRWDAPVLRAPNGRRSARGLTLDLPRSTRPRAGARPR